MTWRYNDDSLLDLSRVVTKDEAHVVFVNQAGDTMTGDLDLGFHKLKNANFEDCLIHTTPRLDGHPVSKQYLDERLQGLDAIYVNGAGDTMEGELKLNRNKLTGVPYPTVDTDAANKKYVDNKHKEHYTYGENTLQLKKAIDMNRKKITELADPTANTDAANKKYVDQKSGMSSQSTHFTLESNSVKLVKPLDANSKIISNLAAPVNANDAATKTYVEQSANTILAKVLIRVPKIIPVRIDIEVKLKKAIVTAADIDLGIRLPDLPSGAVNLDHVATVFNFHPNVIKISKSATSPARNLYDSRDPNTKLTLTITLYSKTTINWFTYDGLIMILPSNDELQTVSVVEDTTSDEAITTSLSPVGLALINLMRAIANNMPKTKSEDNLDDNTEEATVGKEPVYILSAESQQALS